MILSGRPNFCNTALRFSKNAPEFLRSFGHSRARMVSSSVRQARLPCAVESSSARIFIAKASRSGGLQTAIYFKRRLGSRRSLKNDGTLIFALQFEGNPLRVWWNQIVKTISPFNHTNSVAKKVVV